MSTALPPHVVRRAAWLNGRVAVPGDKSISHRYALLASLATGTTVISGFAPGRDCQATLLALEALGVAVRRSGPPEALVIEIEGRGLRGLRQADDAIDAQNSGSTLRMLAGVVAAHSFATVLTGDGSLRRRPMHRIVDPLERMGATITTAPGDLAPLVIHGTDLQAIDYATPVASAQVKSAVLLAGLQAEGVTVLREPSLTRDHTERALAAFGAAIERDGLAVRLRGGQTLQGTTLSVPGDLSSAAFWLAAAAALPGSDVTVARVGLNPTRHACLDVLRRFGAEVTLEQSGEAAGEPLGRVRVRHRGQSALTIRPDEVPGLIDELPALAALAALSGTPFLVTGARELRNKESDRIRALVAGLARLGVEVDELDDGFYIRSARLRGAVVDPAGDHRLAMAFALVGLGAQGPVKILDPDCVAVSYPGFFTTLEILSQ